MQIYIYAFINILSLKSWLERGRRGNGLNAILTSVYKKGSKGREHGKWRDQKRKTKKGKFQNREKFWWILPFYRQCYPYCEISIKMDKNESKKLGRQSELEHLEFSKILFTLSHGTLSLYLYQKYYQNCFLAELWLLSKVVKNNYKLSSK